MNKKISKAIEEKSNPIDLSDWQIEALDKQLKLIGFWRTDDKDKNVSPQDIILNIQNIFKNENIEQIDTFWKQHCSASIRELLDKNFLERIKKTFDKKTNENYSKDKKFKEIVDELDFYKKFFNGYAHFNLKEAIDFASKLSIFKKEQVENISKINFNKIICNFIKTLVNFFKKHDILCSVLHKKIDNCLSKKPEETNFEEVDNLIKINEDTYKYFWMNVSGKWFTALLKNKFFDVLKKDSSKFVFSELWYLFYEISETQPKQVVNIIRDIQISKNNINHKQKVEWFTRICSVLPANELVKMIPKMKNEKWIQLKCWCNFEYEKMFKTLAKGKKYESILILAEAVLEVKVKKTFVYYSSYDYFYFDFKNNPNIKVFEYLTDISDEYIEQMLKFFCDTISEIVKSDGLTDDPKNVFDFKDNIYLENFDFFTLDLNKPNDTLQPDIIEKLLASIKKLIQKIIDKNCENANFISDIYEKYFKPLPDNLLMWKLKLFVMSLCPNVFQNNLKKSFWRLFDYKKTDYYYRIQFGTEYKKTLKKTFKVFDSKFQREFVEKVFKYFEKISKDKRHIGWEILSSICEFLSNDEKNKCEEIFGKKCDSNFLPEPSIVIGVPYSINSRGELSDEEFNNLSIANIVEKLKTKWQPEKLDEKNRLGDSNPINSRGTSSQLQRDILKRPQEYISNANLFFEKNSLHENYTYGFLFGLWEFIRINPLKAKGCDWSNLIDVMITMVQSFQNNSLHINHWNNVFQWMSEILKLFLNRNENQPFIDFNKFRDKFFQIIVFLLQFPNPQYKDEKSANSFLKIKKTDSPFQDLISEAINTVRGVAFEAFVGFVFWDIKIFTNNQNVIKQEVKDVYENFLKKENTLPLMFVVGQNLPFFHFYDENWIHELLSQIFPTDSTKQNLYIASWAGYVIWNNQRSRMFFVSQIQKLLKRWFELKSDDDLNYQSFSEINKGIAAHIACPFIIFHKKFGFENELFKMFWKNNSNRQAEFIKFIGFNFVLKKNTKISKEVRSSVGMKKRIWKLWEWTLKNYNDPKIFESFGFWINVEKGFFNLKKLINIIKKTLEKSKGILNWPCELEKHIDEFAKIDAVETFKIVRLFLSVQIKKSFKFRGKWNQALKTLYNNPKTKIAAEKLISDLVLKGGIPFKYLKNITKKNSKKSQQKI